MNKPILITTGEPAGVGPDICLAASLWQENLVFVGDINMLRQRAKILSIAVDIIEYAPHKIAKPGQMMVQHIPCLGTVVPGLLNDINSVAVLEMLQWACEQTLFGEFSALVTAPVHKAHLQIAEQNFLGHTEFFQKICQAPQVVMMLADKKFRVALVTTHLPMRQVPDAITAEKIINVVETLNLSLQHDFKIAQPSIAVAGLNPHAGENGALGNEELLIIQPAIEQLRAKNINVTGPFPADTMFLLPGIDVFVAMYHDQGLGVLKYATFGNAANISLGLPIIRTSVDHGTALNIAGTNQANTSSMKIAIEIATEMAVNRGLL